MAKELTSVSYLITERGPVLLSELTPEEKSAARKAIGERVNKNMTDYFQNHYQEYLAFVKAREKEGTA